MINKKINTVNYIECKINNWNRWQKTLQGKQNASNGQIVNFKEVLLLHNEVEFSPEQATSELLSD